MICTEALARDDHHVILCMQDFSSLLSSSTQVPVPLFHRSLEDDVLAIAMPGKQADGVSHASGVCAFLPLTPPPG